MKLFFESLFKVSQALFDVLRTFIKLLWMSWWCYIENRVEYCIKRFFGGWLFIEATNIFCEYFALSSNWQYIIFVHSTILFPSFLEIGIPFILFLMNYDAETTTPKFSIGLLSSQKENLATFLSRFKTSLRWANKGCILI